MDCVAPKTERTCKKENDEKVLPAFNDEGVSGNILDNNLRMSTAREAFAASNDEGIRATFSTII